MSERVDFLIVGGGICGRLIQLELEKRGKSTLVVDDRKANQCSIVAAGLANPLVGKFFTIGWRSKEFFGGLYNHYQSLENRLDSSFFRPSAMKRVISTPGEQNIWLSKAHQEKYVGFCSFANEEIEGLNTSYGLLEVVQGGQLNAKVFLNACMEKLPTSDELFDYNKLNIDEGNYGHLNYDHIIFCEGYKLADNPWFNNFVHLIPTKGEILEIETALEPKGDIYLGGVFIQHVEGEVWRVGATYDQNNTSTNPTEMMREDLVKKLEKTLLLPYKIVAHYCGTRPASEDRKPIVGSHPKHRNMHIFNGMGSKAVSLAPLLAKELSDNILEGIPLEGEIDVKRFC
ncbi:MAG: hypothetical protein COA58_09005 [Bacteroidetes bacterium]|nr:MAG: hypothetical protein COA58_09005 [Bacteroidota bacterium]